MTAGPKTGLVADIGGTNARFALVDDGRRGEIRSYPVMDFPGPAAAIGKFLGEMGFSGSLSRAVLAMAGPVDDERGRLTNGVWEFNADGLEGELNISQVRVVNDFAVLARGLPLFGGGDLYPVGGGAGIVSAPRAVLGPGTGLGVAIFVPVGAGIVVPTEGGHASLSTEDGREADILAFLRKRFGHVSAERVLSGGGLETLYGAIQAIEGGKEEGALNASEITDRALAGTCGTCKTVLKTFCAMLGSFAGNVALTTGARGGVYLAGGIVPRFPEFLEKSEFRERFEAKGRFRGWLSRIPVSVVTHPEPAFPGLVAMLSD
jgi:glucokinase